MNMIISLRYQGTGGQKMPNDDSVRFWDFVSTHYASNPRVFFDLFNEPNPGQLLGTGDSPDSWTFWQDGGPTPSDGTFVGMQRLVDVIRGNNASNLIFADGICGGVCLAMLLDGHTLRGPSIVYVT